MKIQLKLSEKDKKLLFLLFSLIVIAASYFLVYTKNIRQAEEINTVNWTLRERAEELSQMQARADSVKSETEEFKKQIDGIEAQFPVSVSMADAIVLVDELEKVAEMKVSSSQFAMYHIFYPAGAGADTSAAADGSADNGEAASQDTSQPSDYQGLKSTVTITYQTTYEGLKRSIDYINQYKNRMNIEDLSATYDTSTGNLVGNMKINMFSLSGQDIDKTYEPPYISDIVIGRDNIFGTAR